ncbi:hypothetical protein AURDEDRAFT_175764 [Auricularia subglabra TFB-10046 SS5]|uniref:DUF6533 domain-containing protein n=1 Tax=Auricularia subglabra (strain TFB-10046 / SS5) TaxID=717982 RepID=J0LEF6_AURST|nr:hypothetical protein AURDEDRAFT_175764 [Auricularia subglabra TFB-10046 SS5]
MSDPASVLQALKPLVESLEHAKVVYYMHVAATCIFIYDHLTTLADEVEIIWPAPWHAGKIFFLIERYLTWPELLLTIYMELADLNSHVCHNIFAYIAWSIALALVVTELILILRTWALWGGRRAVLISLGVLLFVVAIVDGVIVADYIKNTVFIRASAISPTLKGCAIKSSTRRIAIGWILVTVFELVIVILTVIKGVEHFRTGHAQSSLIRSLYRDGIIYFVYLFVLSLGNLLCIYIAPSEYVVLFGVTQRAFNAILSCKIILHLQAAARITAATLTGNDLVSTMPEFSGTSAGGQKRVTFQDMPKARGPIHTYTSEWFGGTSAV